MALVAMLLLLAVPTAGRALAGASSSDGVWTQMCTMAGLTLVKVPGGDIDPLAPKPAPPGTGMPDDCAYCPVLGAMLVLLAWVALAFANVAATPRPTAHPRLPRARRHPSGLGSRGPPIAL